MHSISARVHIEFGVWRYYFGGVRHYGKPSRFGITQNELGSVHTISTTKFGRSSNKICAYLPVMCNADTLQQYDNVKKTLTLQPLAWLIFPISHAVIIALKTWKQQYICIQMRQSSVQTYVHLFPTNFGQSACNSVKVQPISTLRLPNHARPAAELPNRRNCLHYFRNACTVA